jgi:hypothetical protein
VVNGGRGQWAAGWQNLIGKDCEDCNSIMIFQMTTCEILIILQPSIVGESASLHTVLEKVVDRGM